MRVKFIIPSLIFFISLRLTQAAFGASFIYSESRKVVRVCNLLLPGNGSGSNAAGWNAGMFAVLDQRLDLKPPGWDFVNPLAPPIVTPDIRSRYAGFTALSVGQYVTKSMPCYWDVKLDEVTLSRLLQFDLVYLAVPQGVTINLEPAQRELLRKLVDSGAQLWIDWCGSGSSAMGKSGCGFSSFFLDNTDFESAPSGRKPAFVTSRHHPLISYPFWLDQTEINYLGTPNAHGVASDGSSNDPFPAVFTGVVRNGAPGALPQVAAGQYGSGHIILTANNIGGGIVRGGFGGIPNPAFAAPQDVKFAYNVVSWGSTYTTTYKDAGHSSSAQQGPGAPLVKRWEFTNAGGAPGAAAAIYKGVIFYSDANGVLHAFDGIPQQDLDGDGNPDDGVPDLSLGAPYDEIWRTSIGSAISGPTVCTWPGGGSFAPGMDVVLIRTSDAVVGVQAFPTPLSGPPARQMVMPGIPSISDLPAPTYHNSIIYAVGGTGYLYCYDPLAGQRWAIPEPTALWALSSRPSSPTVGWTQDIGTKALDLMAYWCAAPTGFSGPTPNDQLYSAIFSTRNEPLLRQGTNIAATRYNNARNIDPGWKLWGVLPTGCIDLSTTATLPVAVAGQFQLPTTGLPANFTAATPVFADYQFTRVPPSPLNQNLLPRHRYSPKPEATAAGSTVPAYQVTGTNATVAMGPDGTLYMVGDRGTSSQVAAVQEYGPRLTVTPGSAPVPPAVSDWYYWLGGAQNSIDETNDFTLDLIDDSAPNVPHNPNRSLGLALQLGNFKAVGPPAVTDEAVYVTAKGVDGAGNSATALFAFARKHSFQIKIGPDVNFYDTTGNLLPVKIWQPNVFQPVSFPPLLEAGRVPSQNIDYGRRTITVDNFDQSDLLIGSIEKRPLVAGVPVTVLVGDIDVPVDWRQFTNLLWYFIPYAPETILPSSLVAPTNRAQGTPSPPTVLGDYVYFGTQDGHIYAVRTDARPSRGKQIFGIKPNYMPQTVWDKSNKDVAWQEKVSSGEFTRPVSGAGGLLAAVSSGGLAVFDSPTTLIVDNNRILEVDGGSQAVWSLDGTTQQQLHGSDPNTPTGYSARKTPFSRPSVARITEGNSLVVCDSGNNRIVKVDRAGQVQWEIRDFEDPLRLLASGEPRTLAGPTDVRMWSSAEKDPLDPNGPMAFVYHYLVADRDNFRMLDLVVRFDANGKPLPIPGAVDNNQPVTALNWVSSSRREGRLLRYETAQTFVRDASGNVDALSAVSNYSIEQAPLVAPADAQGGGIVRLDYATVTMSGNNAVWTYHRPGKVTGEAPNIMVGGKEHKLVGPRFFERFWVSAGVFHDIICDNEGVWELDDGAAVVWSLSSNQYKNSLPQDSPSGIIANRGVPLRASSAKVLPNGNMLITNEFTGLGAGGAEFHGEVFEVNRQGANPSVLDPPNKILWSAPAITLATNPAPPPLVNPVQEIKGSYIIEQPTFADRR